MDINKKVQKITLVFTIWTLLYLIWYRWVMLENYDFNIFLADDWKFIFNKWWNEGWIIEGSYFWIFVILLFLFIPLWILGLCLFSSINYRAKYEKIFEPLIYKNKSKKIQANSGKVRVKRKKTYLEVRPRALSVSPQKVASVQQQPKPDDVMSDSNDLFMSNNPDKSLKNTSFSRREVTDDFEGDSPFETPDMMNELLGKQETEELKEDLPQIMEDAGAVVISKPTIDKDSVTYLALSQDKAFLVLTDYEEGDWLADEERFNDEDPLWFSETAHRISPITTLKNFEASLQKKLSDADLDIKTQIILVKTNGNIINAEDMLSIWEQMNAWVARSSFGLPEELPSFTEVFPKDLTHPDEDVVEKVETIVKK
ncbi:MAG: hypothetical protein J6P93_05600 [Alphaproteobacteria bacterium]|nr:hypothetical protein [Alphaproteobacteria bacterium]